MHDQTLVSQLLFIDFDFGGWLVVLVVTFVFVFFVDHIKN